MIHRLVLSLQSVGPTRLTVKVQADGGVTFAQLVLGRHFVLASVFGRHVGDLQRREVRIAIFFNNKLAIGKISELLLVSDLLEAASLFDTRHSPMQHLHLISFNRVAFFKIFSLNWTTQIPTNNQVIFARWNNETRT